MTTFITNRSTNISNWGIKSKSSSVEFNQYKNLLPANEDNIYTKNMIFKRSWCCYIVKKLSTEVENEITDLLEIILQTHLNTPLWSGQKGSIKVYYRPCSIQNSFIASTTREVIIRLQCNVWHNTNKTGWKNYHSIQAKF